MSKAERGDQLQLPETETEVFIPLSDVLEIIDNSLFLLEHQKNKLKNFFEDFKPTDEMSEMDIILTVRAVVEGLHNISFNLLAPTEQRRIVDELHRYGIEFNPDKT